MVGGRDGLPRVPVEPAAAGLLDEMLRHLLLEELRRRVLDAGLARPERVLRRVEGRLGDLATGDLLGDVGRHPERGIEQHRPLDQVRDAAP